MKKLFLSLILGVIVLSCSKDDNSSDNSLSNTPTAKAAYDNNNYGIYKGVFVGSTGYVSININNDGTVSAKIIIDGNTFNFTTTETVTLNSGIEGLTFTSGNSSFDFNVSSDGSGAVITNISINGHPNATIYIIKEKSDKLVKCFQGTAVEAGHSGSATFNIIVYNGELHGLARSSDDDHASELQGTVTNNLITGLVLDDTVEFSGTINGDNISGTWHDTYDTSSHGTWSGVRKL